jgi:hypothetical protein
MGTAISASASTVLTQAGIVQATSAKAQTSIAANNGFRAFMFSSINVVFRDTGHGTRGSVYRIIRPSVHLLTTSVAACFSMTR